MKRCPFRKRIIYVAGLNTGNGYPNEWIAEEEFEKCIEKKCAAFQEHDSAYTDAKISYCELCRKQEVNAKT